MVLSGKELSARLLSELSPKIAEAVSLYGRAPSLSVVLVGDDPASVTYVRNKGRACAKVGILNSTVQLPGDISQEALLGVIASLNADPSVDGILVQLPLPEAIDPAAVTAAIDPSKDVDGFHPLNSAVLYSERDNAAIMSRCCVPCTPRGIMRLLEEAGIDPDGKKAVVVGRSNIVGFPVAKMLLNAGATVTLCHSHTQDLAFETVRADILVVAVGSANLVGKGMVKSGATVIDVGISRTEDGRLHGDVDFEAVKDVAANITPVPGGVGPMTICSLMLNTFDCYIRRISSHANS